MPNTPQPIKDKEHRLLFCFFFGSVAYSYTHIPIRFQKIACQSRYDRNTKCDFVLRKNIKIRRSCIKSTINMDFACDTLILVLKLYLARILHLEFVCFFSSQPVSSTTKTFTKRLVNVKTTVRVKRFVVQLCVLFCVQNTNVSYYIHTWISCGDGSDTWVRSESGNSGVCVCVVVCLVCARELVFG